LILDAIAGNEQTLCPAITGADRRLKSKAWNDSKVVAHHAIIPTPKKQSLSGLTSNELKIYQQVARQYIIQFYPNARYADSKLVFDIAGGCFIAKGRVLIDAGWKVLIGKEDQDEHQSTVPALEKGTELLCREGEIKDRKTEPPKHFTEATLLQAMTGIAKFVADKKLRKILRETDGLGTEATRAGILETLFKRKLLTRSRKLIISTPAARGLIHALPSEATYPDMTAHWEHQLQAMAEKNHAYQPFMEALEQRIQDFMAQIKAGDVPESLHHLPQAEPSKFKRKRRAGNQAKRKVRSTKPNNR